MSPSQSRYTVNFHHMRLLSIGLPVRGWETDLPRFQKWGGAFFLPGNDSLCIQTYSAAARREGEKSENMRVGFSQFTWGKLDATDPPSRSIVLSMSLCLFARTTRNCRRKFLCTLPVAVARSFSDRFDTLCTSGFADDEARG